MLILKFSYSSRLYLSKILLNDFQGGINKQNNRLLFSKSNKISEKINILKLKKNIHQFFKCKFQTVNNSTRRKKLLPNNEIQPEGKGGGVKLLIKPFLFTIGVTSLSYIIASILQYEELRSKFRKMRSSNLSSNYGNQGSLGSLLRDYGIKAGELRRKLNFWWNGRTETEKSTFFIIGLNSIVFLLWRFVPMQKFMITYFTASPWSKAPCISMLLSTFSHFSAFHLFLNMYILHSFASTASHLLGNHQYLATYVSAGVVSSFGSYVFKVIRYTQTPSLGASGAIMGMIGLVCIMRPEAQLSVALVDHVYPHSFSAHTALLGLLLMDSAGVIFHWKLFDHAAHLSGLLYGIWYGKYGGEIWQKREGLVRKWHNFRNNNNNNK